MISQGHWLMCAVPSGFPSNMTHSGSRLSKTAEAADEYAITTTERKRPSGTPLMRNDHTRYV